MRPEVTEKNNLNPSINHNHCIHCVSWKAIIVSAIIAMGLSFLVNIFSSALGLTAFTNESAGQVTLMVGGFIWLIFAYYLVMFTVGWLASMIAGTSKCWGLLHGFAAWCLALILMLALFPQPLTSALGSSTYYTVSAPPTALSTPTQANSAFLSNDTLNNTANSNTPNKLGIGVLAIFFVFGAGALGSCIGGYVSSPKKSRERSGV